jgi:alpha-L-fucosidase
MRTPHTAPLALDGNLDTWWEAAPGQTTATLTLKLPKAVTFDVISLQEAVDHRGQRIESFSIDVWHGSKWDEVDHQTTVGHKRLLRLNAPATTDQVRIRITGSRLEPTLAEAALFKQAELVQAPTISDRDANGSVTLGERRVSRLSTQRMERFPIPNPLSIMRRSLFRAAARYRRLT